MAFFEDVESAPPDPIFGINTAFKNDPRSEKINLGVGTFKTDALEPFVLETVKKAEKKLLEGHFNKDYLPIEGDPLFLAEVKKLVLGEECARCRVLQTIGGTGALRLGADFLQQIHFRTIHLPLPTWDNHRRVFTHARFNIAHYPYYDSAKKAFDLTEMLAYLEQCHEKSVVLLQASCHNPTGFDPTREEWHLIMKKCQKKKLLPFFDYAYQGFGEGLVEDSKAVRLFLEEGMEFFIAASFSKNFGIYAERVGALFVVCNTSENAQKLESQFKVIIRGIYSNPVCHGSRIVAMILSDPNMRVEWEKELTGMRERITRMRRALIEGLKSEQFQFMRRQKGMFSYTGLGGSSVEKLTKEFAIYLPKDGRINVAGLNDKNLPRVIEAINASL